MSGYVVIVDFRLKPGGYANFRAIIDANAMASMRNEPGCFRFDVIEPEGEPDRVLLYEIYEDAAAFERHRITDHFLKFDSESKQLVAEKSVIVAALVCEGVRDV